MENDVQRVSLERWRLLRHEDLDAYTNMSLDEAVLWARSERLVENTVRLYTWKPSAVSMGYFQSAEREVNLDRCRELGVDVVRRITGGGAVYHAYRSEVTYSLVLAEDDPRVVGSFSQSFKVLCGGVVAGLRRLGVQSRFQPINDIVVADRKISGSAQTRRDKAVLQHGTVIVRLDPIMFEVLRVSQKKMADKGARDIRDRVTSIEKEKGQQVNLSEVFGALKNGFEEALRIELAESKLASFEEEKSRYLRTRYSSSEWNRRR